MKVRADDAAATAAYEQQVRPLLAKYCVRCHGAEKQQPSLRLDYAAGLKAGGNSDTAIIAGKSAESLIIQALLGQGDVSKMPPEGDAPTVEEIVKIAPEYRLQGIGQALVLKALSGFRSLGLKRVYLEVTAANFLAVQLYRSIGFRVTRTMYRTAELATA